MSLPDWLKLIKGDMDKDDDGEVTMMLHAPVGMTDAGDGVTSRMFGTALNMVPKNKKVTLEINTMGGKVDDGIAMYNMLRARGNVKTRVVGYAASMGAVIAQAGTTRCMMPGTMMIIHNPQANPGAGDHKDMSAAASMLGKVKDSLVDLLADRTKQGKRAISGMMDDVTAMTADEAKKLGFCDEIEDGSPAYNEMKPKELFEFLRTCRNGGPGSGPRPGGGKYEEAEKNAESKSDAAMKETDKAEAVKDNNAAAAHREAAAAHREAASKSESLNDKSYHEQAARQHSEFERAHRLSSVKNQLEQNNMTKTIIALAKLNLLPSADMTDEAAAPQAEVSINRIIAERDSYKVKLDGIEKANTEALKTRVTNRVEKAITDKLVKVERKDSLIAAGISNEASLDFLNDLAAPRQPRGAAPVPKPEDGEHATLETVRSNMRDHKGDGLKNYEAAMTARELRGHKNLFAKAS